MPTTTIRIAEEPKARIVAATERARRSSRSFNLEAIAEKAEEAEQCGKFDYVAEKRYAEIPATGKTISSNKMRAYLEDRLAGKPVTCPLARRLT